MEAQLQRIRNLSPDTRHRLRLKFSQWFAANAADADTAKTLTAVYVADPRLTPDDVRAFLRERLPDSMVPTEYVAVDALPKTVTGKIDRRALQQLVLTPQRHEARRQAEPMSERERRMVGIWSRILNVADIDCDANFFELGGHSLLATQVIMEIEQQFGIEIPLGAIFSHPTIARLCRHLESKQPTVSEAPVVPAAAGGDAPLSHAQRRLWYASQVSDQGLEYKIVKVMDMRGRLNIAALTQALSEIVNRHESLRTTFRYVSGTLMQRAEPARPMQVEFVDLTGAPPPQPASGEQVDPIVAGIVRRPFDLEIGPLIRVTLVRYAETHVRVIFDVHHLVVDGWSFGIIIDEVNSLYRSFASGRASELPPLPLQYRDVAIAEERRLGPALLDQQLAYWRRRLAGLPDLDFARTPKPSRRAADGEREFTLTPALSARIAEACGRLQLTPFMFLASVYHLLLQLHSGARDIAIGADVSNRESKDYAGVIGFFVNQVVLRITAEPAITFRQLAQAARTAVEEAFANKDLPFESVVSALSESAKGRRAPLFRAMLSFHHQLPDIAIDDIVTSFAKAHTPMAKYDILLNMEQSPSGLQGSIEYSGALFDQATVAGMIDELVDLCERIVRDVDAPVASLLDDVIVARQERTRTRLDRARADRENELRSFLAARTS